MTVVKVSNAVLSYEEEPSYGYFSLVTDIDAVLEAAEMKPEDKARVIVLDAYLDYEVGGNANVYITARLDADIRKRGKGWWKRFLEWLGLA